MKERLLNALTVVVAVCAVVLTGMRIFQAVSPTAANRTVVPPIEEERWREFARDGISVGNVNAPVTLVEYSDFLCPFCKETADHIQEVRTEFGDSVRFIYRHLPLHAQSRDAALAAECAAQAGKFDSMHDALFRNAERIGVIAWEKLAVEAKISDTVTFNRCRTGGTLLARLTVDSIDALRLRVESTPTIIINNKRFRGYVDAANMKKEIRLMLAKKAGE